jgi:peptide deformylase
MKLIKAPDQWLQTSVKDFDFDALDPVAVSGEMCQLMTKNNGIGLAANQVGLDAKIFVMQPLNHREITKPFAVINPIIREISEETEVGPEGCLSYPGLVLHVARPRRVVAQFLDIDCKDCIIEFTDIDARCFLHEFDHLQGIVYTDRVSKLKLDLAKKKQNKLLKRINKNG